MRDAVRALGLQTRTGVHCGECALRGERVRGFEVHVMAAAGTAEIIVNESVRGADANQRRACDTLGSHKLKGVPGNWELCRLNDAQF